jgi:hypothetical protein
MNKKGTVMKRDKEKQERNYSKRGQGRKKKRNYDTKDVISGGILDRVSCRMARELVRVLTEVELQVKGYIRASSFKPHCTLGTCPCTACW